MTDLDTSGGRRHVSRMTRVYASNDPSLLAMLQMRLDEAGIRSAVFNQPLASVVGEVAFNVAVPEIWVSKEDADRARPIVEAFEHELSG